MKTKTEGELFWENVARFQVMGYSATASRKAAHAITDGKKPDLPPLKAYAKRKLPSVFRDYLRPFIKDDYGEEQVEVDIDAIIQFLEDN